MQSGPVASLRHPAGDGDVLLAVHHVRRRSDETANRQLFSPNLVESFGVVSENVEVQIGGDEEHSPTAKSGPQNKAPTSTDQIKVLSFAL